MIKPTLRPRPRPRPGPTRPGPVNHKPFPLA